MNDLLNGTLDDQNPDNTSDADVIVKCGDLQLEGKGDPNNESIQVFSMDVAGKTVEEETRVIRFLQRFELTSFDIELPREFTIRQRLRREKDDGDSDDDGKENT